MLLSPSRTIAGATDEKSEKKTHTQLKPNSRNAWFLAQHIFSMPINSSTARHQI